MRKIFNFNDLSDNDTDELIDIIYNHYYYIVDNIYERNNKRIERNLIAEKLKSAIIKYVLYTDHSMCLVSYIYSCMYTLEYHFKYIENKNIQDKIYTDAYNGDHDARSKIFMNYISKIDEKAEEIYTNYKILGKYDSLITLDDIKQIMYLKIWKMLNHYYDNSVSDKYFSVQLNARMNQVAKSINNYINNIDNDYITSISNVSYSNSYFVDSVESSETLDIIASYLNDNVKNAFNYFRLGYRDSQIAGMMNVSTTRVGQMKNKIKQIVKENEIER